MLIVDPQDKQNDAVSTSSSRMSHDLITRVSHIRLNPQTGALKTIPEPSSSAELDQWLESIELLLKDGGIPRLEWPEAAILLLDKDGDVRKAMYTLRNSSAWTWDGFTAALREYLYARPSSLQTLRNDHPIATTVAGTLLIAAVSPPLLVGALNVLGFGSAGVATGSVAAGAQSIFYGAATTGIFSACQSAGAAGLGATATALTSAVGGAASFTFLSGKGKDNKGTPTETPENDSSSSSSPPPYSG